MTKIEEIRNKYEQVEKRLETLMGMCYWLREDDNTDKEEDTALDLWSMSQKMVSAIMMLIPRIKEVGMFDLGRVSTPEITKGMPKITEEGYEEWLTTNSLLPDGMVNPFAMWGRYKKKVVAIDTLSKEIFDELIQLGRELREATDPSHRAWFFASTLIAEIRNFTLFVAIKKSEVNEKIRSIV